MLALAAFFLAWKEGEAKENVKMLKKKIDVYP